MLVQLSDLHLRRGDPGPEAKLRRALALVAAMEPRPDAVMVSGDIADVPEPEVYAHAREILDQAGLPLMAIPGNHDDRDLLVAAFGPLPVSGRAGPLRVLGVDTSLSGRADGRLREDAIEWLDTELGADPETPTVVVMHHPPVLTGIRALDAIGLPAADRTAAAALLGRHPQVQTVACGHVHRTMATALGGASVVIAPGVSSQLRLDLRPEDDLPIEMTAEPSGLALHVLVDGGIRSHVQPIADD